MLHKPDLSVSLGQATSAGPKPCNDDFHGALLPEGEVRVLKGLVFALADGISTSELSAQAAQTAVKSLLSDYITTPESWTVKTAASRVIAAANSWLHAQTSFAGIRDRDRGHVCTLSALILKGRQAHLFHVGDSRIWRLAGSRLEPLTTDHRVRLEGAHEVLSRAIGAEPRVEIDYACESVRQGDVFLLTSDGLHEHWDMARVVEGLTSGEALDALAERIVAETAPISDDNLTLQIVRVESLPLEAAEEVGAELAGLPWPRDLAPGRAIDGYTLLREIHANHRSQIFLAEAPDGTQVALKVPASALRDDRAALRRFMCEEWVARRLSHPNVLSAPPAATARTALYSVTDYVEGQTLRQWMHDTPEQTLDDVRSVIGQTIKALRAFHRREMLHQDLRPENIMLGAGGRLTLIDFGSAYVAGVQELGPQDGAPDILGTFQYTAPEYFTGEAVSWR
ncbi:MAG: protein phosphatase 2C domain-containing protein, partial [Pseudomonadota bacterium]